MELTRTNSCETQRVHVHEDIFQRSKRKNEKNVAGLNGVSKNSLLSSCSKQFEAPVKVFLGKRPENAPSCQFSRPECDGEVGLSTFCVNQMTSFERACYEDFQTCIPEITGETQFPGRLCEDVSSPTLFSVFPTSDGSQERPFIGHPKQCYLSEFSQPFGFGDDKEKNTRAPDINKFNASSSIFRQSGVSWPNETKPGNSVELQHHPSWSNLHRNAPFMSGLGCQETQPSRGINHCTSQFCSTVSIRVDITCPYPSCNYKNGACGWSCPSTPHPVLQNSCEIPVKKMEGSVGGNIHGGPLTTESIHRNGCFTELCAPSHMKEDCLSDVHCGPMHPPQSLMTSNSSPFFSDSLTKPCHNESLKSSNVMSLDLDTTRGSCVLDDQRTCWNSWQQGRPEVIDGAMKLQHKGTCFDSRTKWGMNFTKDFSLYDDAPFVQDNGFVSNNYFKNSEAKIYAKGYNLPQIVMKSFNENGLVATTDNAELTPINPRKIFGQCKFQTNLCSQTDGKCSADKSALENKTSPMFQCTSQEQTTVNEAICRRARESSLLCGPSSPIENLSNLVAKIGPEDANMAGQRKHTRSAGNMMLSKLCIYWKLLMQRISDINCNII